MYQTILILIWLCVIVAIFAAVGHAIWVILAGIFRWIVGQPRFVRSEPPRRVITGDPPVPPDVLLRRQLDRLHNRQLIGEATYQEVLRALDRYADEQQTSVAPHPPVVPLPPVPPRTVPPRPVPPRPVAPGAEPVRPVAAPPQDASPPRKAAPPTERAARYMQHREQAARDAAIELAELVDVPRPSRQVPWSRLFAAFLEEKNIRWGELVGGLLIVSCSIALVVSFWSAIAERPFLKFGVLNGVTASLFALGLYAARRWRLPTTSQGILLTSTLLVPLNFLAIAAFSEATKHVTLPMLAGELFSVALFSVLVYLAAKLIVPDWPGSLTMGVIVPSVCQLTMRRFVGESTSVEVLYGFCSVGLVASIVANGVGLRAILDTQKVEEQRGNELLKRLGVVTFSLFVALGLLLVKTQQLRETLQWLSPLSILAVIPVMVCGILLWLKPGGALASHRMAGAGLLAAAVLTLVGGFVLAWPQPALMTGLCVSCCVALVCLASVSRLPAVHTLAFLTLTPAVILATHVFAGRLSWTETHAPTVINAVLSGLTGRALTGLALVAFAVGQGAAWMRHRDATWAYTWAGIIDAAFGLILVCAYGFGRVGDPEHVSWILSAYTIIAVAVAIRACSRTAMAAAGALLLGFLIQTLVYGNLSWPWVDARLVVPTFHALMMVVFAGWLATRAEELRRALHPPVSIWIRITSVISVLLICVKLAEGAPLSEWSGLLLLTLLGLAATWCGLAWLESSSGWFLASQMAIVAAGMVWIDTRLQRQPWFAESSLSRLFPQSLQMQAIWLALFALGWTVLRGWLEGAKAAVEPEGSFTFRQKLNRLASTPAMGVDHGAGMAAIVLLIGLTVYGVIPGVAQELMPRESAVRVVPAADAFLWHGIPHDTAHHGPTWILGILLALLCILNLRSEESSVPMLGLALVSSTVPFLLSSHWEPVVAVASALRWYSAGYLLLASILVWMAPSLGGWAQRVGLVGSGVTIKNRVAAFCVLACLSLAPIIGMALFVSVMALSVQSPAPADWQAIFGTAIMGLVGCVVLLIALGVSRQNRLSERRWIVPTAASSFVLAVAPLFAVTLFVIGSSLAKHPVMGPDPTAWFARIGLAASYAVPLLLTSVAVIGHAIYCRSHRIAFAGGLLLNASATAAYLLTLKSGSLNAEQWIRLSQINAIIASLYGLGWSRGSRWLATRSSWIWIQRGIASGFALLPVAAAMLMLSVHRGSSGAVAQAGDVWGWLGLLTLAAFWWSEAGAVGASYRLQLGVGLASLGLIMLAIDAQGWSLGGITGQTMSLHAMQLALFTSGTLITLAERWGRPGWTVNVSNRMTASSSGLRFGVSGMLPLCGLIAYTVSVSLQRMGGLRWEAVWVIAGFLAATVLATDRGWLVGRQRWWFLASLLFNLAASFWWARFGADLVCGRSLQTVGEMVGGNVIALAGLVPMWVALGRRRMLPGRKSASIQGVATGMAIVTTLGLCLSGLLTLSNVMHPVFAWGSVLATSIACFSTLWDPRLKWSGIACYMISLMAVGTVFDRLNLPVSQLLWSGTLMLSIHGVLTSYVWSRREAVFAALKRFGVSRTEDVHDVSVTGIVILNVILACFICVLGTTVQLSEWLPSLRLVVSQAVGAQAIAVGLLAHGRRATSLRYVSLLIGTVAAVLFSWSWLPPDSSWLNRTVVTACALMCTAVFYAVGLIKVVRRENDWTAAASRLVPPLVASATVAVLGVLVSEIQYFVTQGEVPIAWPAVVAVALALAASAIACLIAAVVPGRDPLGLNERQRMGYVYAAEALLAILMAHLRVCVPELFGGVMQRYWTLIVMGLAFLGVGLSEFFRRRRREVLAVPLERTGVVMPLLPMIGFWVGTGEVHLSLIMLAAGGLYAALSVMRRSFGFGVLAALAANGGLWYFLQTTAGIQFLAHPQIWLIPPAVCALAAAYLNRDQLNESQMTSIRYLASAMIYTSSTADIFVNGVAEAPWLPFVLAGLSLAGIFAGIMLRVRAFLFLGLAFLGIALFTVIWHAAVDLQQTWLWYVSGIVAGVLIIALFAVFERKRHEVLRVVDQLKTWER